ncbi:copper resistance protein CopC [Corynebacterium casei]|uniref:copper resistance protein CopC n=1 Tax=Corynebacterium casei TaxID=160386 RepID=UPI003FD32BF3
MRSFVGHITRVVLPVMIGLLIVLPGTSPAFAHAQLLSTTPSAGEVLPQAPDQVEFIFNEPVTLVDESVRLFSGDNGPVTLQATVTDTILVAELPNRGQGLIDGGYTVSYRVVSADNHPVSGAVAFSVGDAAAEPNSQSPPEEEGSVAGVVSVLTALQYLGLLVFAGLALFNVLVTGYRAWLSPHIRVLGGIAGLVAITSAVLLIPVAAVNTFGGGLKFLMDVGAWTGSVSSMTLLAATIVLVTVALAWVTTAGKTSPTRSLLTTIVVLTGLSTPILVGHSQAMEPRALIIAADLGHLWAGAVWAGGIIGLLMVLILACHRGAREATDIARIVARFSRLAAWSVLTLVGTGVIMAVIILDDLTSLFTSTWGWSLLTKIALLLPVLGVAAYNRFRLLPVLGDHADPQSRWSILVRTLVAEAVLVGMIITATGFLTNLEPRSADSGATPTGSAAPVEFSGHSQGMQVTGELSPGTVGENTLNFDLEHTGTPVQAKDITLTATLPEYDLGPLEFEPQTDPLTGGYRATVALPVAGEWSFRVGVRVSRFSEPLVTITTPVREYGHSPGKVNTG